MIGIYKITNIVNGKVYIGKSIDIEKRITRHRLNGSKYRNYAPDSHLYRAMHKYGMENFKFEIIEECKQFELNEKERYYIKKYDSANCEHGYNQTLGGDGNTKVDRIQVINLWNSGLNISEISRERGCTRNTVKQILNENDVDYKDEARKRWVRQKSRKVSQYSIDGKLIREWNSAKEVERTLGFDHSGIGDCCNYIKKQSNGFIWRYAERSETAAMADLLD